MNFLYHIEYGYWEEESCICSVHEMEDDEYTEYKQKGGIWNYYEFTDCTENEKLAISKEYMSQIEVE